MVAAAADRCREALAALANHDDTAVGLADTAFALAGLRHPERPLSDYLTYRDGLAAEIAAATDAGDCAARAAAFKRIFADGHRYRGDDRDDEDVTNADLMWVVDHRRGAAGALGLLALDAVRAAGWPAEGLILPGRLLLRLQDDAGTRIILDPFDRCQVLDPPALRILVKAATGDELGPTSLPAGGNRDILIRLQNEVKLRLLRCGLVAEALAVAEAVLLFAPQCDRLWRECGLMHLRLGDPKAATAALEQFVARTDNSLARRRALQQLQDIRQRLI